MIRAIGNNFSLLFQLHNSRTVLPKSLREDAQNVSKHLNTKEHILKTKTEKKMNRDSQEIRIMVGTPALQVQEKKGDGFKF